MADAEYKMLMKPGKWHLELDENGLVTKLTYDEPYRRLFGFADDVVSVNGLQGQWTERIHPDDFDRLERYWTEVLKKHPEGMDFDVEYRLRTGDGYHWVHDYALCVRREDGSLAVCNGAIFDIQDAIDKQARLAMHEAMQENYSRLLSLEDNFEMLYDVDLKTGNYNEYIKGQILSKALKGKLEEHNSFFTDAPKNIERVVCPEDRDGVKSVLNMDYIRRVLAKDNHFDWHYRLIIDERPVWYRMRIVYKDETKNNIILGVFNAEAEMLEQQKKERSRTELINQMLGGESIYIIRPQTDEYKVLFRNRYLTEHYSDDGSYSESVAQYIGSDVHELDREKLRQVTSLEALEETLKTGAEADIVYRDISAGVASWYRMRALKLSDTEVLLGFANYDMAYTDQLIHERLQEDYFAMFLADLDTAVVKVIKKSPWYHIGDTGDTVRYAPLLQDLASHFVGDTKSFFERLCNINYVRAELASANKLACTYKSPIIEGGRWVRVEVLVLTRHDDGMVATMALGFRLLDAFGSEKQELQVKLAEALKVIQAEKNRYDALHDLIHSGQWSFEISANDEIVSFNYSAEVQQLIDYDLPPRPYSWAEIIHPEEREAVVAAFDAAIADHSGRTLFDATYRMRDRNGNYNWFRSAGKVVRNEDGSGDYFGIHVDITERIKEEREQQERLEAAEQLQKLIKRITDKFDVAFMICLSDGSFKPLKIDEQTINETRWCKNFIDLRDYLVRDVVFAPDRERVRRELDVEAVRQKIAATGNNYCKVEFRALVDGAVRWNEVRVIFIDDDNLAVGFADKNEEIILRSLDREEYADLFALFSVDLDSGLLQIVKKSPWDDDWALGGSYPYEAVIRKIGSRYQGENGKFYNRLADLDYLRKWFAKKGEKFSASFRSEYMEDDTWITVNGRVIIRNDDGSPAVFTLGFAYMDTLASERQKVQQLLKENMEMIGGLASGYLAVYYVNIDEDFFKVYSLDETRLADTKRLIEERSVSGWATFQRFGRSEAVHPADRRIFAELSADAMRAKLAHSKKFTVRFRRNFNGRYLWSEMDVVKCEGIDERANTLIVGFAERDAEIRSEKEHEENFARRVAISDYIINSYGSAYYCNFIDNSLIVLHMDDSLVDSLEGKLTTMKDSIDRYIDEDVDEADRERLRAFFTVNNVRRLLADTETAHIDFRDISTGDPGIYRCTIIRGEDDNHVFVGFRNISAEVEKQQMEQEQLKKAKEVTELIDRFVKDNLATFIVNAATDSYSSMKPSREEREIFGTDPSFRRTFERYADRVYVADRELLKKELNIDNIRRRLAAEGEYVVRYRGIPKRFTTWFELGFSKLNEGVFILAIADVTEEAAQELTQRALSQNSYSIFLIDLVTDTSRVVKRAGIFFGESEAGVHRFSEVQGEYIKGLSEKYRAKWEGLGTTEGVRQFLRDEDKRELIYESPYRDGKVVRCTWQVIERIDGEASTVCQTFSELDEQQGEQEKLHQQIAQQLETIGGVASEYTSLYHVNLLTGEYTPYNIAQKIADIKPFIARHPDKIGEMLSEFTDSDLVLPEFRERLHAFYPSDEGVRAALADKKKLSVTFRRNYGGEILWTEGDIIKCEDINEPARMAVVGFREVDETVRTRLEQQEKLEAALKSAEVANQSKSSFLFNMSHDIRTPMNAIKGFTTMAQKYLNDKARVADYLNKIHVSGRQLLNLINQVLEMSRIESGKIEFDCKPVNIKEKFEPFVTILAEQAKTNGQEFHYSLSDIRHYDVLADEARMGQITLNIAGNALKYTPEGGRIDFILQEKPCGREGFGKYTLTVADTGIGMSEEYLKVLFEPFTREKSSTVSHIQGTGLGMSIVKKLVDLMGGTIEVQSELGKGTRFDITVELELVEEAEVPVSTAPIIKAGTGSFKGKRVLLVEDNELNREIAKDILEEFGMVVEEADDGDVAVELVKAADGRGEYKYYSLVLMDIQMPKMNGYDATRAIRAIPDPTGGHLPIVAMTANAFEEDRRNAIAAGMDDHLAKPIEIEKLLETLAKYL